MGANLHNRVKEDTFNPIDLDDGARRGTILTMDREGERFLDNFIKFVKSRSDTH